MNSQALSVHTTGGTRLNLDAFLVAFVYHPYNEVFPSRHRQCHQKTSFCISSCLRKGQFENMDGNFSQSPFGQQPSAPQASSSFPTDSNNNPRPANLFGFSSLSNPVSPFPHFSFPPPQPFASSTFNPAAAAQQPQVERDPFAPVSESGFASKPQSAPFLNDPFKAPPGGDFAQGTGSNNFGTWDAGQGSHSAGFGGRRPFRNRDRDNNSSLFLNNVPLELFSQEAIAEHFRVGFRGVTNVSLRGSADSKRTAVISFESPEDATNALNTCSHFNGAPLNLSIYMSYAQRAAAASSASTPSSGPMGINPVSNRAPLNPSRPPSQSQPPNRELVFSPVPKNLFSKEQIANLFGSICPDKVENVLVRERRFPNGTSRRTAIVIMVDVASATAALENLPLYEGERLRVQYRTARPPRSFQPADSRQNDPFQRSPFGGSGSQQTGYGGDALEDDGDLDMVGPAGGQDEFLHRETNLTVDDGESGFQYGQGEDPKAEPWGQNVSQDEPYMDDPADFGQPQQEPVPEETLHPVSVMHRISDRKHSRRSTRKKEGVSETLKNEHLDRPRSSKLVTADNAQTKGEWRKGEKIDLSQAKSIVGTCCTMCPEEEMEFRARREDFSQFETTDGVFDRSKAVKKYRRSAAISEAPLPEDIRPPDVLVRTMDYLKRVCDEQEDFAQIHMFVRDRTRSLRQDFTYQGVKDERCIQVHEEAVRFHILSEQLLSELPVEQFSGAQNHEQLDKCLISLREMYDLRRDNELPTSPNEPEMQAYYMLVHMTDQKKCLQLLSGFHKEVRESDPVQFAIRAMRYGRQNSAGNPLLFFKCVREAPYLAACLLKRRFSSVRYSFIGDMASSFGTSQGPDSIPIPILTERLGLDDDSEAVDLFRFLGFTLASTVDIEPEMDPSSAKIILPSRTARTDKIFEWQPGPARQLVDDKGEGLNPSQIIAGEGEFVTWRPTAFGTPSPPKVRKAPSISKRNLLRLSMGKPPQAMMKKYERLSPKRVQTSSETYPVPTVVEEPGGTTGLAVSAPDMERPDTLKSSQIAVQEEMGPASSAISEDMMEFGGTRIKRLETSFNTTPNVAPVLNTQLFQPPGVSPWFTTPSSFGNPSGVGTDFGSPPASGMDPKTGQGPSTSNVDNPPSGLLPTFQTVSNERNVPTTIIPTNAATPSFSNTDGLGSAPTKTERGEVNSSSGKAMSELETKAVPNFPQNGGEASDYDQQRPAALDWSQTFSGIQKAPFPSAVLEPVPSFFSSDPPHGGTPDLTTGRNKPEVDHGNASVSPDRQESDEGPKPDITGHSLPKSFENPLGGSEMAANETSEDMDLGTDPKQPGDGENVEPREAVEPKGKGDTPCTIAPERDSSPKNLSRPPENTIRKGDYDQLPARERELLLKIRDSLNFDLADIEKSVDKMRRRYFLSRWDYANELLECKRLQSFLRELGKLARDAKDIAFKLDCKDQWVGESLSMFAASINVCPMRQASLLWDEVSMLYTIGILQQEVVDLNVVRKYVRHQGVLRVGSIQLQPDVENDKPQILREHELRKRTDVTQFWKRRPMAPADLLTVGREIVNLNVITWQGAIVNLSGTARQANKLLQLRLSGWTTPYSGVLKAFHMNDLGIDRYASVVACETETSVPETVDFLAFTVDMVPGVDFKSCMSRVIECLKRLVGKNKGVKKFPPVTVVVVHDSSDEPKFTRRMNQYFADYNKDFLKGLASKFIIFGVNDEIVEECDKVGEVEDALKESVRLAKKYYLSEGTEFARKLLGEEMVRRCEKAWKPLLVFARASNTDSTLAKTLQAVNQSWRCVADELSVVVRRLPNEVGNRRADVVKAKDAVEEGANLPAVQDIGVTTPAAYLDWMKEYVGREEPYLFDTEQGYHTLWKFCLALHRMIPAFLKKRLGEQCFQSRVWTLKENQSIRDMEDSGMVERMFDHQDRRYVGVFKSHIGESEACGPLRKRRRSSGDKYQHVTEDQRAYPKRLRLTEEAFIGRSSRPSSQSVGEVQRRTMYNAYDTLVRECEAYEAVLDGTMAELLRRQRDAENRRRAATKETVGRHQGHSL